MLKKSLKLFFIYIIILLDIVLSIIKNNTLKIYKNYLKTLINSIKYKIEKIC